MYLLGELRLPERNLDPRLIRRRPTRRVTHRNALLWHPELQALLVRLGDNLNHLLQRDLIERNPLLLREPDEAPHAVMRGPERHAVLHEPLREIRGHQRGIRGGRAHPLLVDLHGLHHGGPHLQQGLDGVERVEDGLLVLLHVAVVAKRHALHDGEERDEAAVDAAGLAAGELADVGVFLLRHEGGAGAEGVAELDPAGLLGDPEDEVLGDAGEVHHDHGDGEEELAHEIAVADAVHGVAHDAGELERGADALAVDGERGAGHGAGAEREEVHALGAVLDAADVAVEHLDVGQQIMRQHDRLGVLQMREPWEHGIRMLRGQLDQRLLQRPQQLDHHPALVPEKQAHIRRDLIVPRPRRMQPPPGRPDALRQPALDIHVQILQLRAPLEVPRVDVGLDRGQPRDDLVGVLARDDLLRGQHVGVRNRGADVVRVHALVVGDGL
mmetsp:Transcript_252/g.603  ORF Transcript_252/g.603 Transcript_252/m.603 type:complete len:441 (+) Transcript_252:107-1429(+)